VSNIGVFALVAVVLLGALMIYTWSIIGKYQEYEKGLTDEYVEAAKALQALDKRYPDPGAKTLEAKRLADWLAVRTTIAELLAERFKDPEMVTQFQVRRTRNLALAKLAETLDPRKMGISEYCAISMRWRALLARKEFDDLQKSWREIVRTRSTPEGMKLPPAAADAIPAEVALVRTHAEQLRGTMEADKLAILLDLIAGGEIPEAPKR